MLTTRRSVLALLATASAGACTPDGMGLTTSASSTSAASSSATPAYVDALAGLYNLPASSVPADVPVDYYTPGSTRGKSGRAVLTMAVVPGANFDALQSYFDSKKSADLDTKTAVQRVVNVLKERYPWIELMDDVATAQQRNVSLTLVVDIRAIVGGGLFNADTAQIDVIVFDENRKPFSRVSVEGRGGSFQAALTAALDQLTLKGKTILT